MKVEFENDDLARICTDQAHKMGLPFSVIKAARRTLLKIEAATYERDLFKIGGLDYKKRKGANNDTRQVRINGQYRIFFYSFRGRDRRYRDDYLHRRPTLRRHLGEYCSTAN